MAAGGPSIGPSSRYASLDSLSPDAPSPSPPPSSRKHHLPSLRRLIGSSAGRRGPSDPASAPGNGGSSSRSSSRALVPAKSGDASSGGGQKLGSMVRKLMDKRPGKSGSSDAAKLVVPGGRIAEDLKKAVAAGGKKESSLATLHQKFFQKGGLVGERTPAKALTEVKTNTRTLAMVLRSERELLTQNAEYEVEISQIRLLLEEKDREVDKLKDLCLKQREEIKALKDAILFPDVMNAQLQVLLDKQGSELKQAKQVIPMLQEQVSSLTGQLKSLAVDLAEVKADKYSARTCFDGHATSPRTPTYDQEASDSSDFSSEEQVTPGSPDDMLVEDLNPCLTPRFSKTKSKVTDDLPHKFFHSLESEYDEMMGYAYGSFGSST
ncbi:hypothetical protein Taro_047135, partial [Colocasia esculenta]|nr:hypothetical protein [Colocasia esculenta]